MAATALKVLYTDDNGEATVIMTLGDSLRAQDWAKKEFPDPAKPKLSDDLSLEDREFARELYREERDEVRAQRQFHQGLYAAYLGAKRANLPHTQGDWREWLDVITMPDDSLPDEDTDVGDTTAEGIPAGE